MVNIQNIQILRYLTTPDFKNNQGLSAELN